MGTGGPGAHLRQEAWQEKLAVDSADDI